MEQAFLARDLAGTLVQVGVPTPDMRIDLPMIEFFGRGGALKPSWYGDCLPSRDFPMLVDLYLDGRLDLDRFVSETIGIDEVEAAFAACSAARCCAPSSSSVAREPPPRPLRAADRPARHGRGRRPAGRVGGHRHAGPGRLGGRRRRGHRHGDGGRRPAPVRARGRRAGHGRPRRDRPPEALLSIGRAGAGSDPARMRAEGMATMPLRGDIRSVQVPGAVDGWLALHERYGRLPLDDVLAPAIELASEGFAASIMLALASHLVHALPGAGELCPEGPARHRADRAPPGHRPHAARHRPARPRRLLPG